MIQIRSRIGIFACLFALATASTARGAELLTLSAGHYRIGLSGDNGAIASIDQDGTRLPLRSGEAGLWEIRFDDGSRCHAADFSAQSADHAFRAAAGGDNSAVLTYHCDEIDVRVTVTAHAEGAEFAAELTPHKKTVVELALPGRLRFEPRDLTRLVCPSDGNQSVGMAMRGSFFQEQKQPIHCKTSKGGPQGCIALLGGYLDVRPTDDPAVAIRATDAGRTWLGPKLAAELARSPATVNRTRPAGPTDLVLIDSPHGPYFYARPLAQGRLWRFGGRIYRSAEEKIVKAVAAAVLERLSTERLPRRGKIGLAALAGGPPLGSWSSVRVREWWSLITSLPAVKAGKVAAVQLRTPAQIAEAQRSDEFLAIFNPYGEWLPVEREGGMAAAVGAVGRYVRAGGNWFETGGYPFFQEMIPSGGYYEYGVPYPPAFADFLHLETRAGNVAVYRLQPRTWKPWQGASDPAAIFVPGRIACGGDERGGWCDRAFTTYTTAGHAWHSPAVRLAVGGAVQDDLRTYCQANAITRRLDDKMRPEVLARLRQSVLVYYAGSCPEKLRHLPSLPVPSLIHFADYLHGGFDKQYPDHLPPSPAFGTAEEFHRVLDESHRLGHLVMPYTNPTWWCDGPKGPTFEREGDAPLLKTLQGKVVPERYGANSGFTICFWHPAVRAANRRTLEQFSGEYPVDVLFQDQCGARGSHYDANPASPSPTAYTEGLLSMVDEDGSRVPLSTESGWDRVLNGESQLCGMTWGIVPTEGGPAWRQYIKETYDPATWEVFPLAQYIAHDKAVLVHHDLGQFVTTRAVLAWTLGLGYGMSDRAAAPALGNDKVLHWLRWLDRVQKSVAARYIGQPLKSFRHQRGPASDFDDDGLLTAQYGEVEIAANLGPRPREAAGRQLAAYGFWAKAPGLAAGNVQSLAETDFGDEGVSFVVETRGGRTDLWVYSPADRPAGVVLPSPPTGPVTLVFDGDLRVSGRTQGDACLFRLPAGAADAKRLWHAVVVQP